MEELFLLLTRLATNSQKLLQRLAGYRKLLAEPVNNAYYREKELVVLANLITEFPEAEVRSILTKWLEEERMRVEKDKEEFRFGFGQRLATGLEQSNLRLRGQLPVLRVGMFSLRLDFAQGRGQLFWGPEVERLKVLSRLVPEELVKVLVQWTNSLKENSEEPERLLKGIINAYHKVCLVQGVTVGGRVALLDVLGELVLAMQPKAFRANPAQENFREYPRFRFSYDLYRLKTSGELSKIEAKFKLHVATFDATTDKTKALWVPDNEEGEGTYYSHVSFVNE